MVDKVDGRDSDLIDHIDLIDGGLRAWGFCRAICGWRCGQDARVPGGERRGAENGAFNLRMFCG